MSGKQRSDLRLSAARKWYDLITVVGAVLQRVIVGVRLLRSVGVNMGHQGRRRWTV